MFSTPRSRGVSESNVTDQMRLTQFNKRFSLIALPLVLGFGSPVGYVEWSMHYVAQREDSAAAAALTSVTMWDSG
jgi:hypothetical protein